MAIDRKVTTVIDQTLCTGCGLCVTVCPYDTISMQEDKAVVTGDESLNCGHCMAACPVNAISVSSIIPELNEFKTFTSKNNWLPHGRFDTSLLVNLMQSRRSCRNFKDEPVNRDQLADLVKIGITAPSGSNAQAWTFTILPTRNAVMKLMEEIARFYRNLNKTAQKSWLRTILKLMGKNELALYFKNYYQVVEEVLSAWKEEKIDVLFHGATAIIVVCSKKDASCPGEDALLATQNILLGAHSMGIGTCLVGFAVKAMVRDRSINRFLDIPADEKPYAVIALGYPNEKYKSVTGRKACTVRYFEPFVSS